MLPGRNSDAGADDERGPAGTDLVDEGLGDRVLGHSGGDAADRIASASRAARETGPKQRDDFRCVVRCGGSVRLRRKLTVAFFGVSSLLSVLLALFLYRFVEQQLKEDLRDRLRDITHIGAHVIDIPAYRKLAGELGELGELDEGAVKAVEQSPEYRRISDQLGVIRGREPKLIQYVYLLAPTGDSNHPRSSSTRTCSRCARSSRRASRSRRTRRSAASTSLRRLGDPLLKKAIHDCDRQFERGLRPRQRVRRQLGIGVHPAVDTAGVPLRNDEGGCLGVIGVDITDRKMRQALDETSSLALKLSLAAVALALLVSIAMGTVLTRSNPVADLDGEAVRRQDFSARTPALSHDEIGTLADNFNAMAETIQVHSEQLEDLVRQRTKELSPRSRRRSACCSTCCPRRSPIA